MAFAPDGRTLVSAGNSVRFWEVATGQQVLVFNADWTGMNSVTFSPDGKSAASGTDAGTILIWDVTGLHHAAKRPPPVLQKDELEKLWQVLAGEDAPAAHRAVWLLASMPEEAVSFLASQLRPIAPVSPERFALLLAELEDERFRVRQRASQALEAAGEQAIPPLRAALVGRPSLELQRRVSKLLKTLDPLVLSPDRLRQVRAVATLEYAATAEARRVLQALAKGAVNTLQTQYATSALARLAKVRQDP